jgi:hypothetical protein
MAYGFHFLLLGIGEILKADDYVNAQKLQDFIANEDAFGGFRVPLADCRLALQLMEDSGFIISIPGSDGDYQRDRHLVSQE